MQYLPCKTDGLHACHIIDRIHEPLKPRLYVSARFGASREPVLLVMEIQMSKLVRFVKDESGATAIEYGLIAAATGLALVLVMPTIKGKLITTFTSIGTKM